MKARIAKLLILIAVILVIATFPTISALARGLMQDAPPPATGPQVAVVVLDVGFLAAITAFIKKQFELNGRPVMYVAFGVGLIIWGVPLLSAAFPVVGYYLESFLTFLKLWIGAMGSVDLVTGIGAKIAAVKPSKSVESTLK